MSDIQTNWAFSPSMKAFYNKDFDKLPDDVYDVSEEFRNSIMNKIHEKPNQIIDIDIDGNPFVTDYILDKQEIINFFNKSVQNLLDDKAKSMGYDSIITAISYADEPSVPKFQKEGLAFRKWRSLVWDKANTIMKAKKFPGKYTLEQFLSELPVFQVE